MTKAREQGQVNDTVIKLLSQLWKIKKSDIEIIKGETSRNKIFLIGKTSKNLLEFIKNAGSL